MKHIPLRIQLLYKLHFIQNVFAEADAGSTFDIPEAVSTPEYVETFGIESLKCRAAWEDWVLKQIPMGRLNGFVHNRSRSYWDMDSRKDLFDLPRHATSLCALQEVPSFPSNEIFDRHRSFQNRFSRAAIQTTLVQGEAALPRRWRSSIRLYQDHNYHFTAIFTIFTYADWSKY